MYASIMSDESSDIKAAELEFFELFGPDFSHQFMKEFLDGFLERYKLIKKKYSKPIRHDQSSYVLNTIKSNVEFVKKIKIKGPQDQAYYVGFLLGSYLGVVEFGITNLMFLIDGHKDEAWDAKVRREIVSITGRMIDYLLSISKRTNLTFIKKRIETIRYRKRHSLAQDQYDLLTEILFKFVEKRV